MGAHQLFKKKNEFEQMPLQSKIKPAQSFELGIGNPNFENTLFSLMDNLDSFNRIFESRGLHPKLRSYLSKIDSNNISSIKISTDKNRDVTTLSAKLPRIGAEPDEIISISAPGRNSISIWRENGLFANIERHNREISVQYG